jgi:hypothetical protein
VDHSPASQSYAMIASFILHHSARIAPEAQRWQREINFRRARDNESTIGTIGTFDLKTISLGFFSGYALEVQWLPMRMEVS